MEVENEHTTVGELITGGVVLMMDDMTATDETAAEIEQTRVAFLVVEDVSQLLVRLVSAFDEGEQAAVGVCRSDESLHELVAADVEDERGVKYGVLVDGEVECTTKLSDRQCAVQV